MPTPYEYLTYDGSPVIDNSTIRYMNNGNSSENGLEFGMIISSDIPDTDGESTFRPHLYIDKNLDGKFSETKEEIKDIHITVKATGEEAPRDPFNSEFYALSKNVEYKIIKEIDSGFSGYISWKLTVDSNNVGKAHECREGCTVVRNDIGMDKAIKILQLNYSGNSSVSSLNLQSHLADPDSKFGKYLQDVDGYDVYIKTITVEEFENDFNGKYNAAKALDNTLTPAKYAIDIYFKNYPIEEPSVEGGSDGVEGATMLVLGFGDNYENFLTDTAVEALQAYIESGSPVILTHDFIMFDPSYKQAKALRELVGMDKYGMTQNIVSGAEGYSLVNMLTGIGDDYLRTNVKYNRNVDSAIFKAIESTGKAVAYEPGTMRGTISNYKMGITSMIINRFADTGYHRFINATGFGYGGGSNNDTNYMVENVNRGQLTNYPYFLPDTFKVEDTHNQYFSLNMDTDGDQDGESDAVVWYTLGHSDDANINPYDYNKASKNPQDNYFVYNKGNVTYLGSGHYNLSRHSGGEWEYEAQLFVNTVFATYQYVVNNSEVFLRP